MDASALHLEIRNGILLSDELARHVHALGNQTLAGQLSVARTVLDELELAAGKSHRRMAIPSPTAVERLQRSLSIIRDRSEEIPLVLRPRITMFMEAVERIIFAEQRPNAEVPSKPLFGLPLARVVPQSAHSIADFLLAGAFFASGLVARTARARAVGLGYGAWQVGMSAATDVKLSAAKVVPVELHGVFDASLGVKAVTMPFALGYVKKDPIASAIQIVAGLGTIALSLFTDFRADKGIARAQRSLGGPAPKRDLLPKQVRNRVPEVQRPLEGLAGDSYIEAAEL